jgi:glucosamine--fructose-6-phosphate aminotransferase (isomerizing)
MSKFEHYSPLLGEDSPLDSDTIQLIKKLNKKEREKALELPTDDPMDTKRHKRVDYTRDEMWGQPEAIRTTLASEKDALKRVAEEISAHPVERIIMTGCGDSLASMIGVRSFYESLLGIFCEPIQALDCAYYYNGSIDENTLLISLSSSGTTTRTVEAQVLARAKGAQTLALSNTKGSPLVENADHFLMVHAERKGWPTQSSTAAMALLYQLGFELANHWGRESDEIHKLQKELSRTSDQITQILEKYDEKMLALAKREAEKSLYLFAGGGPSYAAAFFGAAKVKECSPDHALAIPLEEYHHYNSQKEGDPLFLVAPQGPTLARALDTAREGKRFGGYVYSLVTEGDETLVEDSDEIFYLPEIDERLAPMLFAVPLHLFAYHVAKEKFRIAEKS